MFCSSGLKWRVIGAGLLRRAFVICGTLVLFWNWHCCDIGFHLWWLHWYCCHSTKLITLLFFSFFKLYIKIFFLRWLQLNLADFSDNHWVTCFQETAEQILGKNADELGELKEKVSDWSGESGLQRFTECSKSTVCPTHGCNLKNIYGVKRTLTSKSVLLKGHCVSCWITTQSSRLVPITTSLSCIWPVIVHLLNYFFPNLCKLFLITGSPINCSLLH